MKYSFVLPAYKAAYFREAIDSILSQTYQDFELIIVNDASPEDLDSIVRSYDDSRMQYYVNRVNIGGQNLVAQWNHCLQYATGEYIILASDDDIYFPHYLEKMDALVQKYPNINVFRPRVQVIDGRGNLTRVYGCVNEKITSMEYWYYWTSVGSSIGHVVFNKKALLEKGGFVNFPMAWGSDDATILMLGYNGICFESEILYSFRNSGENITSQISKYHTLIKKIEAHRLFYSWIKDLIERYDPMSSYDIFYKIKVQDSLDNLFQSLSLDLINHSQVKAAIRAFPKLLRLEYTSKLVVMKRFVKRIFMR